MSSNEIRIIPFKPDHYDLINMKPAEQRLLDIGALVELSNQGSTQTLVYQDRVLAIIGLISVFPGVIQVYVVPSVYVYDCPIAFVRFMKRTLDQIVSTVKPLHRLQTMSLASPEIDKWMRVLGFECEGTHKAWSKDKDDFRTWARVF